MDIVQKCRYCGKAYFEIGEGYCPHCDRRQDSHWGENFMEDFLNGFQKREEKGA